jgi:hypothetical protein
MASKRRVARWIVWVAIFLLVALLLWTMYSGRAGRFYSFFPPIGEPPQPQF